MDGRRAAWTGGAALAALATLAATMPVGTAHAIHDVWEVQVTINTTDITINPANITIAPNDLVIWRFNSTNNAYRCDGSNAPGNFVDDYREDPSCRRIHDGDHITTHSRTYNEAGMHPYIIAIPYISPTPVAYGTVNVSMALEHVAPPSTADHPQDGRSTDPTPHLRTCSITIENPTVDLQAAPDTISPAVTQTVRNAGSLSFGTISIDATPWYVDPPSSAPVPGQDYLSLPAYLTEIRHRYISGVPADRFYPLENNAHTAAIYPNLPDSFNEHGGRAYISAPEDTLEFEPDTAIDIDFRINLGGYSDVPGKTLIQHITYTIECIVPNPSDQAAGMLRTTILRPGP